ncbi:hypothetical protein Tco_0510856 [Tanacetum coccineum]
MFDQGLAKEITEMKEVFNQMETEVDKCSVERKCFEIKEKELLLENERLLEHILYQDVMCIAMHADVENKCVVFAINDNLAYAEMEQSYIDEYSKVLELEAELSRKKNVVEKVDYLKETKAHADILRAIVEQARALKPLDNALEYACKFTIRIQELLVYVNATCPSSQKESAKLVPIKPINKCRQIKRVKPSASTTNTPKQADSLNSKISNQPLLTSTRMKSSTRVRRSQPSGNTKNNKISPTASSNQKKIVEDQSRSVKSSFNKKNRVSACNASIKTNVLKVNSESVCKTCQECLFNAYHDLCVVDYLHNVNVRAKSRFNKINKKQEWKPTGHVFTNVGHKWIPT